MGKEQEWQIAFWVLTAICGIWLLALTNNVIANDRLRATEDQKILEKVDRQYTDIIQRLARIEAKSGN